MTTAVNRPKRARAEDPAAAALRNRLAAIAGKAPELAEAAALFQAWHSPLREARLTLPAPEVDAQAAQRSVAAGVPVMLSEDLALDTDHARSLFITLCRAAEQVTATSPAGRKWFLDRRATAAAMPVAAIRHATERGTLDLTGLWQTLVSADERSMTELAAAASLDPAWLRLIGQHSLRPAFQAAAEALSVQLDLETWRRDICPICSSPPLLAEIQGKEGARVLRCGLCGAGWPYPRLQCVFCGTTDHRSLGYLSLEGEGAKYRVQTCDACRGYIKVVVTFDPIAVDLLPVEDLATRHLDTVAAERGFARAPVPA